MRKFELITNEKGRLPQRSTANSGGYDFFAHRDVICKAHEITLIPTGIKAKFPNDEVLLLFNRSSNPKKKGLIIPNGVGVIDADYYNNPDNDGAFSYAFYNYFTEPLEIKKGEVIGQAIFRKFLITDDDTPGGERSGGFGSTSK